MGKWERVKLGDVCEMNPPKKELVSVDRNVEVSFVPMADLQANQIHFEVVDTKKLSEVIKGYTYFKNNDVLLAKITPCFENGKSGVVANLVNGIGFGSTEFIVFRPGEKVLPEWIYYCISNNNFLNAGKNNMTGSAGQQRISQKFIKDYNIPIPSVEEQKKSIRTIKAASELIALRKKQLAELDNLIKSTFCDMFGDPVTNEKGWPRANIGKVAKLQGGFAFKSVDYVADGIRLVKISNVHYGRLTWDDISYLPISCLHDYNNFLLEKDDIIVAMTRPIIKSLNSVKIIKVIDEDLPCLLNQRVGRFQIIGGNAVDHTYLYWFCLSSHFKNEVGKYSINSLQPNISSEQIESIDMITPPIALQKRFAQIVTKVEEQKALVQKAMNESQYLFDSLMSEYFE